MTFDANGLIDSVPSAVAVIVMAWMFLNAMSKMESDRIEHAKTLSEEQRAHEVEINNTWAKFIKQIADEQQAGLRAIIAELQEHEHSSRRRYERMNITNEKSKRKV